MTNNLTPSGADSGQQNFDRVFSAEPFAGLKAILEKLSSKPEAIREALMTTNSYEDLLAKLGYRILLTNQIHVQDCYGRVGVSGGIKAVLPYHHIPTQSSLPTLVNYDFTVTTTPKSAAFFNEMRTELKARLNS